MIRYFLTALTPYSTLSATCSSCEVETDFNCFIRYRTNEGAIHVGKFKKRHNGQTQEPMVIRFDSS